MKKLISKSDIILKRNEVRNIYHNFGFKSSEYNNSFNQLHELNVNYNIQQYRLTNGHNPLGNFKTPFN